ncbi:hypothetical protein NQ317_006601 [Molorchus minor]|uniref:Protein quiver n=1 Tax=Molorchus minor TaxID=1323400 RepID=A0ABQ9JZ10_9CUCU|nr:hypothetical protein NQ317_006601 [Molorchus minor]
MASFIPLVLALLLAVDAAFGLICYKCNSKDSSRCKWGLTSLHLRYRDLHQHWIIGQHRRSQMLQDLSHKVIFVTRAVDKDGSEYIARGCLPPATIGCGAIASAVGWVGSQTGNDADSLQNLNCDTCDQDKCNSAQKNYRIYLHRPRIGCHSIPLLKCNYNSSIYVTFVHI